MSPLVPVPNDLLYSGWRGMVHVEGWRPKAVFKYKGRKDGAFQLVTPTSNKHYQTRNRLLFTRRSEAEYHKISRKQYTGRAASRTEPPVGHERGPRVKGKFYPPEINPQSESVTLRLSDSQSEGHCASGGLPLNTPTGVLSQPGIARVSG